MSIPRQAQVSGRYMLLADILLLGILLLAAGPVVLLGGCAGTGSATSAGPPVPAATVPASSAPAATSPAAAQTASGLLPSASHDPDGLTKVFHDAAVALGIATESDLFVDPTIAGQGKDLDEASARAGMVFSYAYGLTSQGSDPSSLEAAYCYSGALVRRVADLGGMTGSERDSLRRQFTVDGETRSPSLRFVTAGVGFSLLSTAWQKGYQDGVAAC